MLGLLVITTVLCTNFVCKRQIDLIHEVLRYRSSRATLAIVCSIFIVCIVSVFAKAIFFIIFII